MPGNEREFRIRIAAAGTAEAKAQLEALEAAQRSLTESVEQGGKKSDDAKRKTGEHGDALQKLREALAGTNTGASRWLDIISNLSKSLDELGKSNVTASSATDFLGKIFTKTNIAVAAVTLGISRLRDTIADMKEEAKSATEQLQKMNEAASNETGRRLDAREAIRKGFEAEGFAASRDDLDAAQKAFERTNARGLVSRDAIEQAIGSAGAAFRNLSIDEIEQRAYLVEQGRNLQGPLPSQLRSQAAAGLATRQSEALRLRELAAQEGAGTDGSTEAIERQLQAEAERTLTDAPDAQATQAALRVLRREGDAVEALRRGQGRVRPGLDGIYGERESAADTQAFLLDQIRREIAEAVGQEIPSLFENLYGGGDQVGFKGLYSQSDLSQLLRNSINVQIINNPRYQGAGAATGRTGERDGAARAEG